MADSGHFVREVEGVHHLQRARWGEFAIFCIVAHFSPGRSATCIDHDFILYHFHGIKYYSCAAVPSSSGSIDMLLSFLRGLSLFEFLDDTSAATYPGCVDIVFVKQVHEIQSILLLARHIHAHHHTLWTKESNIPFGNNIKERVDIVSNTSSRNSVPRVAICDKKRGIHCLLKLLPVVLVNIVAHQDIFWVWESPFQLDSIDCHYLKITR